MFNLTFIYLVCVCVRVYVLPLSMALISRYVLHWISTSTQIKLCVLVSISLSLSPSHCLFCILIVCYAMRIFRAKIMAKFIVFTLLACSRAHFARFTFANYLCKRECKLDLGNILRQDRGVCRCFRLLIGIYIVISISYCFV